MSTQQPSHEHGEQREEQALSRPLGLTSGIGGVLPPLPRPPLAPTAPTMTTPQQNIITGVDITKLIQYVFEEKQASPKLEEEIERVRRLLEHTTALSRGFIDVYVHDGLSRIIHPAYGVNIIRTRFLQIAELLRKSAVESWRTLRKAIEQGADPKTVRELAKRAVLLRKLTLLVLLAIYEKLLTLLFVNAPAELRAPLANIALGYELLRISEEEAERLVKRKKRRKRGLLPLK